MNKLSANPTVADLQLICRGIFKAQILFERTGRRTNLQPRSMTPRSPVTNFVNVDQLAAESGVDAARILRLANQAFARCVEQSAQDAADSVKAAIAVVTEAA